MSSIADLQKIGQASNFPDPAGRRPDETSQIVDFNEI